jgi:hypothetical protein
LRQAASFDWRDCRPLHLRYPSRASS